MWEAEGSGENGDRPILFDGSRSWCDSRTIEDLSKVILPRSRALSVVFLLSIICNAHSWMSLTLLEPGPLPGTGNLALNKTKSLPCRSYQCALGSKETREQRMSRR